LCAKWQQNVVEYDGEASISKHQIPNNIQIPISNDPKGFCLEFGHLVIGNYLGFGYWNFILFGSGYARLGLKDDG
jgi:hypothetical protein